VDELSQKLGITINGVYTDTTFEFNLSAITNEVEINKYPSLPITKKISYQPFSVYPFALRDIAVWVPQDTSASALKDSIQMAAGKMLMNIQLFDEYKKESRVSYAFKLVFQSPNKTLSDTDIQGAMDAIVSELTSNGFEIR
jgi:phenylalanyl-tRNA synthetase beta chain